MTIKVHVYIATTQGLVAVQNITELDDVDVQSILTIDGSAKLAQVSAGYNQLVQAPAGIIASHFRHANFRVNLSDNIDQGESWQLGIYLAHIFHQTQQLGYCGEHGPQKGEIALVVTGAISTFDLSVKPVQAVSQKQYAAQGQISHWMQNGVMVQWIMPHANKDHVDASMPCSVSAVKSIGHACELLHHQGTLPEIPARLRDTQATQQSSLSLDVFDSIGEGTDVTQASERKELTESGKQSKVLRSLRHYYVGAAILSVFIVAAISWLSLSPSSNRSNNQEYLQVLRAHQNKCDSQISTERFALDKSGLVNLPRLTLKSTCKITLITNPDIESVLLVSESGALLVLGQTSVDDHIEWDIPLPSNQTLDRSFVLVTLTDYFDKADVQSLQAWLASFASGRPPTATVRPAQMNTSHMNSTNGFIGLADVSTWFAKQQYPVTYYVGTLSI